MCHRQARPASRLAWPRRSLRALEPVSKNHCSVFSMSQWTSSSRAGTFCTSVDHDQSRWAAQQPFSQQLGSRGIVAVDVRLEQIDQQGIRQAFADPAGLPHLPRTPQERRLAVRRPDLEPALDNLTHEGNLSGIITPVEVDCPAVLGRAGIRATPRAAKAGRHPGKGVLVVSASRLNAPCGTCTIVPDPYTGFVFAPTRISSSGNAAVQFRQFALPTVPASLALSFYQQWFVMSVATGSCLGGPSTNGLQVRIQQRGLSAMAQASVASLSRQRVTKLVDKGLCDRGLPSRVEVVVAIPEQLGAGAA